MLTREQIGLRLDRAAAQAEVGQAETALRTVVNLLREVLPDLVTLASGRTYADADAGRRYSGGVQERPPVDQARSYHPLTCAACKPDEPCSRARRLAEGS